MSTGPFSADWSTGFSDFSYQGSLISLMLWVVCFWKVARTKLYDASCTPNFLWSDLDSGDWHIGRSSSKLSASCARKFSVYYVCWVRLNMIDSWDKYTCFHMFSPLELAPIIFLCPVNCWSLNRRSDHCSLPQQLQLFLTTAMLCWPVMGLSITKMRWPCRISDYMSDFFVAAPNDQLISVQYHFAAVLKKRCFSLK